MLLTNNPWTCSYRRTLAGLLWGVILTVEAAGVEVVIDAASTPGVAFDGLLDGFPGLAPKDGKADFPNNPLAVVMKTNVVELRSIVEFPLGGVPTSDPAAVVSAVLEFNVDDVLSTLGPGTELSGRAARRILLHPYAGDGVAALADFGRLSESALEVETGPNPITDESLRRTGARWFQVDLTERLRRALSDRSSHLGVLWRTTDSPTGTSLDDGRGGSASGEPSETSAGSGLPRLRVTIVEKRPPPDGDECAASAGGDGAHCDDGDPCTVDDVCDGERCAGVPACGNGVLDRLCAEECDDGNASVGDGCTTDCRHDSTLGGTQTTECYVAIAFARPVRDATGAPAAIQRCRDNDPACDGDPTEGRCGFDVAICAALADSRLPACVPPAAVAVAVRLVPSRTTDRARQTLAAALGGRRAPGCTALTRLDVPLRRVRGRLRPGGVALHVRARPAAGRGADRDVVRFRCLPPG